MSTRDQFGTSNETFDGLQSSIVSYSTTKATALGIPTGTISSLSDLAVDWAPIYAKTVNKKTASQVDTENLNAMRSKFVAFLRPFVKQFYYDNPSATNADILSAGLKVHTAPGMYSRTANSPIAVEVPTVSMMPLAGNALKLKVLNAIGKTGKPKGVVFIRVRTFIGENPPAVPNRWTDFTDNTKGVITMSFDAADAGLPLYIAVCYVTDKGVESVYCVTIATKVPVLN